MGKIKGKLDIMLPKNYSDIYSGVMYSCIQCVWLAIIIIIMIINDNNNN